MTKQRNDDTPSDPDYEWMTTAPHPWRRVHRHGADAGQVGWKLHALKKPLDPDIKRLRALCGLTPAHGWGFDLFINTRCANCERTIESMSEAKPK